MRIRYPVPSAAVLFILLGAVSSFLPDGSNWRPRIWMAGLVITAAPMLWGTVRGMTRGKFAADVVAALAVIAAVLLRQPIVGLVIVVMQTGGEALEHLAEGKASNALRALQEASPKIVHLVRGGAIEDVPVDQVRQGDVVLVRAGEMVPCDGDVIEGESHLDTSSLTGEPVPRRIEPGSAAMSGSINQHGPVKLRVTAIAAESQYARIVALVREAQSSKAPLQRVADKYAVLFTPFTLLACAVAFILSHDWNRVLAVLAIATPCPLILAAPVAILGGFNRSARKQILIRNGGALEALGSVTAVLFDKTGTVTIGRPEVSSVVATGALPEREILRLASGVEQGSSHLLARTLIAKAQETGVEIPVATGVIETPGRGVEGEIGNSRVTVGARSFIDERNPQAHLTPVLHGGGADDDDAALRAYVAVDGAIVGFVEYADRVRPGVRDVIDRLRELGVSKIMLLSGDRVANVRDVAATVGIADYRGDMLPEEKLQAVQHLLRDGERVAMMGDGTNDGPALGTATVGIALASHGRGIATEAADVIILADDPGRILDGITISRQTMRIAKQSIMAGLGISAAGMIFALLGYVAPVMGAAIQEAVDLAVILNALRASRDSHHRSLPPNLVSLPQQRSLLQS